MAEDITFKKIYDLPCGTSNDDPSKQWMPVSRKPSEDSDARTSVRLPYPVGDGEETDICMVCHGTGTVDGTECERCGGTGEIPLGAIRVDSDGVIRLGVDNTSVKIENGKLTAYSSVTAGNAISVDGNKVSVLYDNNTIKTDSNGNLYARIPIGKGLKTIDGVVSVAYGNGLELVDGKICPSVDNKTIKIDSDGHLVSSNGNLIEGVGIKINDSVISVKAETDGGLHATSGGVGINVDNSTIKIIGNKLVSHPALTAGQGIDISNNAVSVVTGNGLKIDNGKVAANVDNASITVNGGVLSAHTKVIAGNGVNVTNNDVVAVNIDAANQSSSNGFWTSDTVKTKIDAAEKQASVNSSTHLVDVSSEWVKWNSTAVTLNNVALSADGTTFTVDSEIHQFAYTVTVTVEMESPDSNSSEYIVFIQNDAGVSTQYYMDTTDQTTTFVYTGMASGNPLGFKVKFGIVQSSIDAGEVVPSFTCKAKIIGSGH